MTQPLDTPPPTAQLPRLTGTAPRRTDYSEDDESEPVDADAAPSYVVEPSATTELRPPLAAESRDRRHYLNEAYAVRRVSAAADRLARIEGGEPVDAPTEVVTVRPVALLAAGTAPRQLFENADTADASLALEYVSPFVCDLNTHYEAGDEYGFSDTPLFSDGRAVSGAVPPKRQSTADDDDLSDTTLEAAAYQHTFGLSTNRYDTLLPVPALAALVPTESEIDAMLVQLDAHARVNHTQRNAVKALGRTRTGVPTLFNALSGVMVRNRADYDQLVRRANGEWVARRLRTPLVQAAALGQVVDTARPEADESNRVVAVVSRSAARNERLRNELPRYEALSAIENSLAEQGAQLPNMLRCDVVGGMFTVTGPVLEYEMLAPASSLMHAIAEGSDSLGGSVFGGAGEPLSDWSALRVAISRREESGTRGKPELIWTRRLRDIESRLGVARVEEQDDDEHAELESIARSYDESESLETVPRRHRAAAVLASAQLRAERDAAATHPAAVPDAADEPKRRRLRRREETVETRAKRGREGEDVIEALDRDVPEPAGIELDEEDNDEDLAALRRRLRDEGLEKLPARRDTDLSALGYLQDYKRPALVVPLGWSAVTELMIVAGVAQSSSVADRGTVWQRAWSSIVRLAAYAKLVPRLRDDDYFPAEARQALVDTLELLALRVSHEVIYHDSAVRAFELRTRIEALQLRDRVAARRAELAAATDDEQRARLTADIAELETAPLPSKVPAATVPAVLALREPTRSNYIATLGDIEAPELLFSAPERKALALIYAANGVEPRSARDLFAVRPLRPADPREHFYPASLSYARPGFLTTLLLNAGIKGTEAVFRFAAALNVVPRLAREAATLDPSQTGVYLETLYRELVADPAQARSVELALADAIEPLLPAHNEIKSIYLLQPPTATDAASRAAAVGMFALAHTEAGDFSVRAVADLHAARTTDIEDNFVAGSERKLANAAQLDANEFFAPSQAALDEAALVDVNFRLHDPEASRPVGVFAAAGGHVSVNREATLAYLMSDALLGRGRVVVSSIGVAPQRTAGGFAGLDAEWRAQRQLVASLDTALLGVPADDEAADPLRAQRTEALARAADLEAQIKALPANSAVLNVAPFFFFISPQTLAVIAHRVIEARPLPSIEAALRAYLQWFTQSPAARALRDASATRHTFNEYRRQLTALETALQLAISAHSGSTTQYKLYEPSDTSLDVMSAAAIAALAHGFTPRILALREEESRPDAVTTQPFSCLAALELATTEARKDIRDQLMSAWHRVSSLYGWARLGYLDAPFNSSHSILLPRVDAALPAFENYQLLYLALRDALRRRRGRLADVERDEGDSDAEDDGESELAAVTELERRSGRLQLEALMRALESETQATQAAHALWFDLHLVGAQSAAFALAVRGELLTLYGAIQSGKPLAAISLLASDRRRYKTGRRPVAIDPRAETIINRYWVDFGTANEERLAQRRLADIYNRRYATADDESTLETLIDDAFYNVLGAPVVAETLGAEQAAERREYKQRQLAAVRAAAAQRELDLAAAPTGGAEASRTVRLVEELAQSEREDEAVEAELGRLTEAIDDGKIDAVAATAQRRSLEARSAAVEATIVRLNRAVVRQYNSTEERRARVAQLRVTALEQLKRRRNNSGQPKPRFDIDDPVTAYRDARIELRASLYADERSELDRELYAEVQALRDQTRKTAEQRERYAVAADLTDIAATYDAVLRVRAAGGEDDEDLSTEQLQTVVRDSVILRNLLAPELLDDEERAVRGRLANEAAARQAVDAVDEARLRLETATNDGERVLAENALKAAQARLARLPRAADGDAQRLEAILAERSAAMASAPAYESRRADYWRRITANVAENVTKPSLAETRAAAQRVIDETQLLALRSALYSPTEQRLRRQVFTKPAVPATVPANAKREATDEALEDLIDGLIATNVDARLDLPATRRVPEEGARVRGGFYDAPLANLKPSTAEAALAANLLVAAANDPENVAITLAGLSLPPEQNSAYIAWAVAYIDALVKQTPRRTGEPTYEFILRTHVDQVIRDAVTGRARLRLQAALKAGDPLAANISEAALTAEVAKRVQLETRVGQAALQGRPLRRIDVAALKLVGDHYASYERTREANAMLGELGTVSLKRSDTSAIASSVPRILILLLLPAAIERAKLSLQAAVEATDAPNWAVANRRDAPQSWRIAEIVGRFAQTGRIPLPSAASAALASPYTQYDEIRTRAKPTLAATGRLRYFPDRARALHGFGLTEQRLSFGNGLHAGQPSATDLFASALCAQLMRVYGSMHNARAGGQTPTMAELWSQTQLESAQIELTRRVSELPLVRVRLWCHLLMFYARRGTLAPADSPIAGAALSLPVWEHMRPIDLRLLVLVVLGFDYSPRAADRNEDPTDAAMSTTYAYSRGHTAKLLLASAVYENELELLFAKAPPAAQMPAGVAPGQVDVYFIAALPMRAAEITSQLTPQVRAAGQLQYVRAGAARPTATASGYMMAAQLNERELRSALQTHLFDKWTTAAPEVQLSTRTRQFPEIGYKLVDLLSKETRAVVTTALVSAAVAVGPFAAQLRPVITDHEWLLIPRAALLGLLVLRALDQAPAPMLPGRSELRTSMRTRLLETLERVLLLTDDARHMLRDDSSVSGAAQMALNERPIAPLDAEPEAEVAPTLELTVRPEGAAPVIQAPLVERPTVRVWLVSLVAAVRSLFAMPYGGALRSGTDPRNPWPVASVKRVPRLSITHSLLGVEMSPLDLWTGELRPAIDSVAAFYTRHPEQLQLFELLPTYSAEGGRLGLGELLLRAEWHRRSRWQFAATGELLTTGRQSLALIDAVPGAYQPWHVLLLDALAVDSTPKPALTAYAERHARETSGVLVHVRALITGGRPTALDVEQCVPIYETLLFYFSRPDKRGTEHLALGNARYPLWPALATAALGFACVTLETSERRDTETGMASSYTALLPLGKASGGKWTGFYSSTYEPAASLIAAQQLPLADLRRVAVLHEHRYVKPADGAPAASSTLMRFLPDGGTSAYSVGDALRAAVAQPNGALSIGGLPLAPSEDEE